VLPAQGVEMTLAKDGRIMRRRRRVEAAQAGVNGSEPPAAKHVNPLRRPGFTHSFCKICRGFFTLFARLLKWPARRSIIRSPSLGGLGSFVSSFRQQKESHQ
jgi:hypothetical protein